MRSRPAASAMIVSSSLHFGQGTLSNVAPDERVNVWTHATGAGLAALMTLALALAEVVNSDALGALAFTAYGLAVTASYAASAAYHASRGEARVRLRRYDRGMIYLVIAGFYTPIVTLRLQGDIELGSLLAVWILAGIGLTRELTIPRGTTPTSVGLYLLMGWAGALHAGRLIEVVTADGLGWFLAGGALYTLGAAVFGCRLIPRNHEIWHVLVLAANAIHVVFMFRYVA